MKKNIYFTLICILFLNTSGIAQVFNVPNPNFSVVNPTMVINSRTYKVHDTQHGGISMYNQDYYNIVNGLIPQTTIPNNCWQMANIDFDKVKLKLLEVFSQQKLTNMSQNTRKNGINIIIYVRPSTGQVIAIDFNFNVATEVTQQELYLLENKILELNFPQPSQCHVNDIMKGEAGLFYTD